MISYNTSLLRVDYIINLIDDTASESDFVWESPSTILWPVRAQGGDSIFICHGCEWHKSGTGRMAVGTHSEMTAHYIAFHDPQLTWTMWRNFRMILERHLYGVSTSGEFPPCRAYNNHAQWPCADVAPVIRFISTLKSEALR